MSYFENRYYIDATGRFTGRDPVFKELGRTKRANNLLSDPQQWNAYSYARNNPVRFTDPTGEFIETAYDAGNVLYDVGRGIKNIGELIGGGVAYGVGAYNNDKFLKQVAKEGIKSDLKDLGEVGIDLGSDSLATAIPGVPAGGTKIARNIAKKAEKSFINLDSHFKKHGAEFGVKTKEEYKKLADQFFTKKDTNIIEWQRGRDGATLRVDKQTGATGIMDKNGAVTTFYKNDQYLKNPDKFISNNK